MMKNPTIRVNPSKTGLTRLNWNPFGGANDWVFSMAYVICNTDFVNSDGKNGIIKMIVFGPGVFTNEVVNLKHHDRLT